MTIQIAVIGNCQARPVANFLNAIADVQAQFVGLVGTRDPSQALAQCETSDLIFAQLTRETYQIEELQTAKLRTRFNGKLVVWPNLFFRGSVPDLLYATADRQRVVSPLGAYHNRFILRAWEDGRTVEDTLAHIEHGDLACQLESPTSSLDDLRSRERDCDVVATDIIAERWQSEHLFFTFNHPSAQLLLVMARRLLDRAGLPHGEPTRMPHREPLGRIIPPTLPAIAEFLSLKFPTSTEAQGSVVDFTDGIRISKAPQRYSLAELVSDSFRCYDAQRELLQNYRVS